MLDQVGQVLGHRVGIIVNRHQRGIRRNHQVIAQAALKAQPRHAKSAVLVVLVGIEAVKAGFRDAPGHALRFPIGDLVQDRALGAVCQQRARVGAQEQRRHQVLEHGRAPGEQHVHAFHLGHRAAKVQPVRLRALRPWRWQ